MLWGMLVWSAAGLAAPEPIDHLSWLGTQDYPAQSVKMGHGGFQAYRLTVSTVGTPTACEITSPTGDAELDNMLCPKLLERARFTPATDQTGAPIFSVYRSRMLWTVPLSKKTYTSPIMLDAVLFAKSLPVGLKDPSTAEITVKVEPSGSISQCAPRLRLPTAQPDTDAAALEARIRDKLGPVACKYALASLKLDPALDQAGKPVPSVQVARLMFGVKVENPAEPARSPSSP